MSTESDLNQLIHRSMMEQAARLHDEMRKMKPEGAGRDSLTFLQRPYARSQTREVVERASVWFSAYMPSIIGPINDGEMMRPLETLCDLQLWSCFAELGVAAVHTGPVMKAGGTTLDSRSYSSVDGWFDPIALDVDPEIGTERDYGRLAWVAENIPIPATAKKLKATVIGDIVPGHTGMGPDFHLALQGAAHYPGLFVLARIDLVLDEHDRRHKRLPAHVKESLRNDFPGGRDSTDISRLLSDEEISALVDAKVIPGKPQRGMGAQAGFGWSITRTIEGVPDETGNRLRRWVYLHFFHPRQPTLNFLDPSYFAWRLVTGQLNYVMWNLQSTGVRIDANAFLAIEPHHKDADTGVDKDATQGPGRQTWSEAHPLSQVVTEMLAWQARRLGGFSFQELNMAVPEIARSAEFGPDLAYDFVTRPACEHAMLTGSTSLLRFMYGEMHRYKIDPIFLVHALQNHDEFTYELVHLSFLELLKAEGPNTPSPFSTSSAKLRADMRRTALHRLDETEAELLERKPTSFYNKESPNGLCTTIPGLLAARLGCKTLAEAAAEVSNILKGHLLLAAFNALQPGVFVLSGWDLVGALPLEESLVPQVLVNAGSHAVPDLEKDFRWVNRGGYRLLSSFGSPDGEHRDGYGCFELPEAQALYGTLDQQRTNKDSFFRQLKRMLEIRSALAIATSEFMGVIGGLADGLFGLKMFLEIPGKGRRKAAAVALFNFNSPQSEPVRIDLMEILKHGWPEIESERLVLRDAQTSFDEGGLLATVEQSGRVANRFDLDWWQWKLIFAEL